MRAGMWHYPSKISCQYIKSPYCHISHILQMSPCHFFSFPLLKGALRGHRCAFIQAIQTEVTEQLCSIQESAFQDCFQDFQKSWKRFIDAGGSYIEGDP
jgi:hypothetical protein